MADENKMPSLSLSDYKKENNNSESNEQNADSKADEDVSLNQTDYNEFQSANPAQNPYWINAAKAQMINGRMPKPKKKSHKLRNAFLVIFALIIVGTVSVYCFIPTFKNSINSHILTSKSYYKWAMKNSLSSLLSKNDEFQSNFENVELSLKSDELNLSVFYSSKQTYIDFSGKDTEAIKLYFDKEKSKNYICVPTDKDNWFSLDNEYYSGKYSTVSNSDFNSYFTDKELSDFSEKCLDIFLDNVSNLTKENGAGEYINGKVYETTKITFNMSGKKFLKFTSDLLFEIADNEAMMNYLSDTQGYTKQQFIDLANNYNMIQKGIVGEITFDMDFTWYVNNEGIITGMEATVNDKNSTTNLVCLYGSNEESVDFDAYVQVNKVRSMSANLSANVENEKWSGTFSFMSGGEKKAVAFSNVELIDGEIIKGINGKISYDEKDYDLSYSDKKQTIKSDGVDYTLEVKRTDNFTAPDLSGAKILYSDKDIENLLQ